MSILLHYECLSQFKKTFYEKVLSFEHLVNEEIKIDKISFPDGGVEEKFNFWGYKLVKDGKQYLLPSRYPDGTELVIADILPIIPEDIQKVANSGSVYYLINKPISVKFKPEKCLSFKELVDTLNDFEHTNPIHRKILVFMALSQTMDRANYRMSTPPGFGKDSVVDVFGNLFGNCATIENPTIAKLEYMTSVKWLAVNEIVDIPKAEWRAIEQFLLSAGAFKPEITKHSRVGSSGVKEILNISNFSLSLMYNDIDNYPIIDDYIDFTMKEAVADRFPPFRFWGTFKEDFNKIKTVDIEDFVKTNLDSYKKLIYTMTYYKLNMSKELKRYDVSKLKKYPQRWMTNINRLLRMIDLYCDTQEEFDYYIGVINDSIKDYEIMWKEYPKLIRIKEKQIGDQEASKLKFMLRPYNTFKEKCDVLKGKEIKKEEIGWFK